ncbi:hypothetical protein M2444_004470 [Paenibacillus sp. PastF-3]|uniref:hypothetical protein n=1 Tax=unclassified Paenibacillus TaxID=185978 RepID=UPI000B9FECCD|nr:MULTISPECIES: hypothetical protein [unclassified Paenibacillus]MDH6372642.1 hypothetical protein [Paenibacillus sp. PastF-3]OZQ91987.1 hypothetical protein CA598_11520 [Paenibacillus sp. VTT E-133291]
MKIQGSTQLDLNAYISSKKLADKPSLVNGTIPELSHETDTVEISSASRQLAASDIVNHSATYFGTTQINDSLTRLLADQPSEVKEAVYGIIQSNFITDVTGDEERSALLELGLTQAKYIADNYIKDDKAAEFMNTIRQIGAISTTRTVDPETKQIQYDTPPQRPVGAPEDYMDLNYMMKKFEPKTLEKLQEAIVNGKDWSSILLNFAKNAATRKDWIQEYKEDVNKQIGSIPSENRFQNTSTSSLSGFVGDIQDLITQAGFQNSGFLTNNIEAFMRTLGKTL